MPSELTVKDLERIEKSLEEVKAIALENKDAILGKVGCPGVVTTLAVLTTQMQAMEKLTSNHLAHLAEQYDLMFNSRDTLQLERDKTQLSWTEIAKEWVKPAVTAVTTAIILAILSKVGIL